MEIKVRKPTVIKFFGFADLYTKYFNRQMKWKKSLPNNGDKIKLTWLPSCINVPKGTPNPYIGMTGIVTDMNEDGKFSLMCETCWLTNIGPNFNYIKQHEKI